MKTSFVLAAAACLLALGGAAHAAQTIASSAMFGGSLQDRAQCIVRNVGTSPVSVTVTIFDESGNAVPASNFCTSPLGPGDNCSVFASISNGVAYACSATAAGSAKSLRGSLVLYDTVDPSDFEPLRSGQLR